MFRSLDHPQGAHSVATGYCAYTQ